MVRPLFFGRSLVVDSSHNPIHFAVNNLSAGRQQVVVADIRQVDPSLCNFAHRLLWSRVEEFPSKTLLHDCIRVSMHHDDWARNVYDPLIRRVSINKDRTHRKPRVMVTGNVNH